MAKKKYSKKKIHDRKRKITSELNAFIKENKEQILKRGKEDLGADLSNQKVINLFKANFRERQGKSLNFKDAMKNLKDTLHTETFTGAKQIDFENFLSGMGKEGRKEFRKLRGWKTSVDFDKVKHVNPPKGTNIRTRFEYDVDGRILLLDLIYEEDGSYRFDFSWRS